MKKQRQVEFKDSMLGRSVCAVIDFFGKPNPQTVAKNKKQRAKERWEKESPEREAFLAEIYKNIGGDNVED